MQSLQEDLLKLYNHATTMAKQTGDLAKKVNDLETKLIAQQALVDISLGFMVSKTGKDEFKKHLKHITASKGFSKEAKLMASEMLRQENLWPGEMPLQ